MACCWGCQCCYSPPSAPPALPSASSPASYHYLSPLFVLFLCCVGVFLAWTRTSCSCCCCFFVCSVLPILAVSLLLIQLLSSSSSKRSSSIVIFHAWTSSSNRELQFSGKVNDSWLIIPSLANSVACLCAVCVDLFSDVSKFIWLIGCAKFGYVIKS